MKYTIFSIICGGMLLTAPLSGCGSGDNVNDREDDESEDVPLAALLAPPSPTVWDTHLDSAPDEGCIKIKIRPIGPLRKAFNDSNYLHLQAAEAIGTGIINSPDEAWAIDRPLVELRSCRDFFVDNLTHSYPYLVPEAADLLHEVGRRFNDSLDARGGGDYRIKVTSAFRTPATVKRLRRVNRNATDSSAHQFATTFDISYSRFICDSINVNRSFEDLKNLLAEVLSDLRDEERCYVKYERRQSCFHVTARPYNQ